MSHLFPEPVTVARHAATEGLVAFPLLFAPLSPPLRNRPHHLRAGPAPARFLRSSRATGGGRP